MVRTILLNNGRKIPAIGWGNGSQGLIGSGQLAVGLGVTALKEGILHIDTAQWYKTEPETGLAIKAAGLKPSDVWVTTKLSGTCENTAEEVKKSVQDSLSKLGFIPDLLLIHSPQVPADGDVATFWQHLEALVEDGTLKDCALGVSNFRPQDLEAVLKICKIKPVINQFEYHPLLLAHLDPVMKIHEQHGIVTEAYGPLQPLLSHPSKGGSLGPVLTEIASKLASESGKAVDEAAVIYLWVIGKGAVVVTTSKNPANIKKMAEVDGLRDLTPKEIEQIDDAGRKMHWRYYGHMNKDFPSPDLPEDA